MTSRWNMAKARQFIPSIKHIGAKRLNLIDTRSRQIAPSMCIAWRGIGARVRWLAATWCAMDERADALRALAQLRRLAPRCRCHLARDGRAAPVCPHVATRRVDTSMIR